MARVTLSFKGHPLSTHPVDGQPLLVGRDPGCQICIDSLAVAPRHALISSNQDGFSVKALDSEHPVRLNMERIDNSRQLDYGDVLQIGKHTLILSNGPADVMPPIATEPAAKNPIDRNDNSAPAAIHAYLQVQSGPELGRILTFKRAVTRLTKLGADNVIVTRSGDDMNLSLLTDEGGASIDGFDIKHGIEIPLQNGSIIEVSGVRCRFYCERR